LDNRERREINKRSDGRKSEGGYDDSVKIGDKGTERLGVPFFLRVWPPAVGECFTFS
jgi:hypothetical protein